MFIHMGAWRGRRDEDGWSASSAPTPSMMRDANITRSIGEAAARVVGVRYVYIYIYHLYIYIYTYI